MAHTFKKTTLRNIVSKISTKKCYVGGHAGPGAKLRDLQKYVTNKDKFPKTGGKKETLYTPVKNAERAENLLLQAGHAASNLPLNRHKESNLQAGKPGFVYANFRAKPRRQTSVRPRPSSAAKSKPAAKRSRQPSRKGRR